MTVEINLREYDEIYEWYIGARNHNTGVESVKAAFGTLPQGATVIDLGCGTGVPLASVLVNMGLQVIGLDSSRKMIDSFRDNFPECTSYNIAIQDFDYTDYFFDGALCWGCLFHLQPDEQIRLLNKVFNSVQFGGRFLFTSAKESNAKKGEMINVEFNYYSLGSYKYNQLAKEAGWILISEFEDDGYVYLFEKIHNN